MKSGVAVYGGFLGTETQLTERDWIANPTVLSGDVDHNDTSKDANGIVTDVTGVHGNNAQSVVVFTADVSNAIVDGFVINAGRSIPPSGGSGGGVSIILSSPTLKNLIIIANSADSYGAGLMVSGGSPDLTNVVFRGNYLTNQSLGGGGGMYTEIGDPKLSNVLFSGNRGAYGGGFFSYSGGPTLINVTFSGNSAEYGGAIYVNSGAPILTNAIIWGNSSAIGGASAIVTNSIVQGGYTGTANQDIDPQFVNPVAYTSLHSTAGDYHLQASSPAIDAGNNTPVTALTDLDGNPRIVDGDGNGVSTVDLGVYEGPTYLLFLPLIRR